VSQPSEDVSVLTKVGLTAADGARAEVSLNGAHVVSWCPAPGDVERLFLSARSSFTRFHEGVSIRGGIPVIFPQFAKEGPLPKHGFVRTSRWTLNGYGGRQANGDHIASFSLNDSPASRDIWPHSFRATLTVRVGGQRLATTLAVENTSKQQYSFTSALHTYLGVLDVRDAEILGLQGYQYRETRSPGEFFVDDQELIRVDGAIDRVYINAPTRLTLQEPTRALGIETKNFPDVVIWNPGAEGAVAMSDMEPGGERRMLCIEAAAVQTPVVLDPGKSWSGTQTLIAQPRTP
jgi:glucose-6-phosphate 1-epimerase